MFLKTRSYRILSTQILLGVFLFLIPHTVWATGWNDYSLPIGDNFAIYRMNASEYCVGRIEGSLFICSGPNSRFGSFGPMAEYAKNQTHIFTRYYGIKPANLIRNIAAQIETTNSFLQLTRKMATLLDQWINRLFKNLSLPVDRLP